MSIIPLLGAIVAAVGLMWLVRELTQAVHEGSKKEGAQAEFERLRRLYFRNRIELEYELLFGFPRPTRKPERSNASPAGGRGRRVE